MTVASRASPLLLLAAALVGGCGRVGFDAAGGDTGGDGSTSLEPFPPGAAIAALASASKDDDPAVTSDGLELYFASDRPGGPGMKDIWWTARSARTDPWPAPSVVSTINSVDEDRSPALSANGLTLWIDRQGVIYVATRPDRAAPWTNPIPTLSDPTRSLGTPDVCGAGTRMFLRINDGGVWHLATSTRASTTAAWDPPLVIAELNSNVFDSGPHPTEDCQRLYFDSTRSGKAEIYVAEVDGSTGRFGTPTEIELGDGVQDPSLTADERYLVCASTGSSEDILETSR